MMRVEPREDDPSVNIMKQSGAATVEDKIWEKILWQIHGLGRLEKRVPGSICIGIKKPSWK